MATDSHDKMIEAFQNWQERFEYHGSDEAGIKSRFWLSEIRNFASVRRKEIQDKRQERKESRKGMVGRPSKVSKTDGET